MTPTAQTEPPLVALENVVKVFRDFWGRPKVRALDGISLEVRPGEVFGLLGPNGSGKSTAIKLVLGLLYPTRGRIRVLGQSPRAVRVKARIGYLPEESYLYPYLSSEETLEFYGRLFDLDRRTRRERIEQLMEMIGLQHARRRAVGEFSKGMARRVGLAQALINDPDLVLLDEPTSGLDPIGCRQVKDLILMLARRGKTVVVSSHLLADVEDVCDRIVILFNGQVCAQGDVASLLERKDACLLSLPALPVETMKEVIARVREAIGTEPELRHPRRNLEQFFLEAVRQAQQTAAAEPTGVRPGAGLASYLTEPPEKDDVLARLTRRED